MINRAQVAIGLVVLMAGIAVYLFDRPADSAYFLDKASIFNELRSSSNYRWTAVGGSLPCFAHTFAFILITGGLISNNCKGYLAVSVSWLLVDGIMELGQQFDGLAVSLTPDWFSGIPFFENTKHYFRQGTFDWCDMAFIVAGSLAGYVVLVLTQARRQSLRPSEW